MMKQQILSALPGNFSWAEHLHIFGSLPSTSDEAKHLAQLGSPEGTTVIARRQTAGRGRMGRQFDSQQDLGLYLSVILRPNCLPQQLMHLTCAMAVAACDAVAQLGGLRPQIKWTNDLIAGGKKLGGILTELSIDSKTGLTEYAVVGFGINCLHTHSDFPETLQDMAISLAMCHCAATPSQLAGVLLSEIFAKNAILLTEKAAIMDRYRALCMTTGKDIMLQQGKDCLYAKALGIDDDGGLLVRLADGSEKSVTSGEVSVRGMYGYL